MNITKLNEMQYNQLRAIHEKHYKDEFSFPDFSHKYIDLFCISSCDGRVVCAGGVRHILESVIITDKDMPALTRIKALQTMHQATTFSTDRLGFKEFHVFIQDENYERQLIKSGFVPTRGKCLVYKV